MSLKKKKSYLEGLSNCLLPSTVSALKVDKTKLENSKVFNLQPCPLLYRADVNPITKCTQDTEGETKKESERERECVIILCP